jgi:hypothetical protein
MVEGGHLSECVWIMHCLTRVSADLLGAVAGNQECYASPKFSRQRLLMRRSIGCQKEAVKRGAESNKGAKK